MDPHRIPPAVHALILRCGVAVAIAIACHGLTSVQAAPAQSPPPDVAPPAGNARSDGDTYQALVTGLTLATNTAWQSPTRYGRVAVTPLLFTALQLDTQVVVEGIIALYHTTKADGTPVLGLLHSQRHPYALTEDGWQLDWSADLSNDGTPVRAVRREFKDKVSLSDLHRFIEDSRCFLQPLPTDHWLCIKAFEKNWTQTAGAPPSLDELKALQRKP